MYSLANLGFVPSSATISSIYPIVVPYGLPTEVIVTFSKNINNVSQPFTGTWNTMTIKSFITGTNTVTFTVNAIKDLTTSIGCTVTTVDGATGPTSIPIGTVIPPTVYLSYNTDNYLYSNKALITNTGSWTFQAMMNITANSNLALLFHFCGAEIHDTGDGRYFPMTQATLLGYQTSVTPRILGKGNVRFTLVRSGNTFTSYVNGTVYNNIGMGDYVFTNTYFSTKSSNVTRTGVYPYPSKTWDHIMWDSARTATQILNNDVSGALHRYSLDNTNVDSIGGVSLDIAGTPLYIV